MMLPVVLDPWAGHALYEAAKLAQIARGSKAWRISLNQKESFEFADLVNEAVATEMARTSHGPPRLMVLVTSHSIGGKTSTVGLCRSRSVRAED